jgi:hypothetical protein
MTNEYYDTVSLSNPVAVNPASIKIYFACTKPFNFFSVDYPLRIFKENGFTEIRKFNSEVDAELLPMLSAAREYVNAQKESPDEFLHLLPLAFLHARLQSLPSFFSRCSVQFI